MYGKRSLLNMNKLNMIANVTLALAVGFSASASAGNMKVKINKKL